MISRPADRGRPWFSGSEGGTGPYSKDASRVTYETLTERARRVLAQDGGVVIDATFRRQSDRALARDLAVEAGAEWRLIECRLAPELVRERLKRRTALKEGLSDATWETHLRQTSEFEPFDDCETPRLELDLSRDIAVIAHTATDWLREEDRRTESE